ncbi:AMP-binding enzyme [Trichinella nativa]|uniref:long-chain-fatty-acid--CoA ligase n=1 Tax=Trichinella nativa TaxID=6335 RepID=A0A1Y3E432_9BILA|nr:AMP-binding enzyme [Trichinella nativa]
MRHGLIVLLSTTTLCLLGVPLMLQIILLFVVWCYIEQRFLKCAILTAPRDAKGLWMLFRMQWKLWRLSRQQCTVHKLFDIVASRTPDSVALEEVESGQTWTFAQLQWHSMRLAGYFREECNLHPGDVVALYFLMALGVHLAFSIRKSDRIYVTMPMYHTAAIILGIGQTLLSGCTCIIRSRFSASQYWHDCLRYRCTAAQYIGEMCRYLLLQPPKEIDRKHGIRLMYGNGLRIQIWKEFVKRFGIEKIGEFYGSTEGNTSVLNIDNHVGACGFMTIYSFLSIVYPIALIKVDETTGELMRDERGLCIRCKPGESGEMVGRIIRGNPLKDFTGYVCDSDSQKKITRDVFRKNDIAFRSGDILYYDELGYLFFKDRTGDTYRWKGENVSTTEVEGLIQKITSHNDAVVYGVSVPGYEGRAGMAAIVDLNSTLDVNHLHEQMTIFLPKYAQPIFLRICQKVTSTSTYKLCKTELVKEGFNPVSCISDQLYVLNHEKDAYEVLDALKYQDIIEGRMNI